MVRMAYTPKLVISVSNEAPGCLRSPVEAEYGSGLHRVDAKAEVKTAPAHIETGFSRGVDAHAGDRISLRRRYAGLRLQQLEPLPRRRSS